MITTFCMPFAFLNTVITVMKANINSHIQADQSESARNPFSSTRRSGFRLPEKAELCELMEKMLTRDLQHGASSTFKRGSDRAAQVMQLDVNHNKTGRIVGCRIVSSSASNLSWFTYIITSQDLKSEVTIDIPYESTVKD
ncbi:hypothetical protein YC2023_099260 [Brassica napus]